MTSGLDVALKREEPEFSGLGSKEVPFVWGKHGNPDPVDLELVK